MDEGESVGWTLCFAFERNRERGLDWIHRKLGNRAFERKTSNLSVHEGE
jgi:hypothetical protein